MQSTAKDVDTYIKEAPVELQEALTCLRDLCLTELTSFTESMQYGGPPIRAMVKWKLVLPAKRISSSCTFSVPT